MTLPIDILKLDDDGPRWIQATTSMEEAKAHIHKFAETSPGEYLIMNQITGSKVVIKVNSEIETTVIAPTDGIGPSRTNSTRPAES
jgi:hypothetical protein